MQITAENKRVSTKLPMKWEKQAGLWNYAFAVSALKTHQAEASQILREYDALSEARNLLVHGIYERFFQRPPIAIEILKIKADGGLIGSLRQTINCDWLAEFTFQANQLNSRLIALAATLSPLQAQPPLNAQRL